MIPISQTCDIEQLSRQQLTKVTNLRVLKQFLQINFEKNLRAFMIDGASWHFKGCIYGPKDTPYEGGEFQVDIKVPQTYPFQPPKVRFDTKVWHPNISANGVVFMDILQKNWSPAITLRTVLLSLQALLSCPNFQQFLDEQMVKEANDSIEKFNAHVKQWVQKYASSEFYLGMIQRLKEYGFDQNSVKKALIINGYDEYATVDFLLQHSN